MTMSFVSADLLRGVADHLWQSTVWVAAAAVLAWLTRRTHPRAQIWIWVAASVKWWVPFAVLIALGNWMSGQAPVPAALDSTRVAPYVVVQAITEPFSTVTTPSEVSTSTAHDDAVPWATILGFVWASGALVISGRWWRRWRRITRIVSEARVAESGREVDALAQASSAMRWASPLAIALTTSSIEPGVVGVRRMTLLWPIGLSDHLDDEQLYTVMLHELSHAQRRDNVIAAAHMVVEAAFWFYPVVWWLGSRLVAARELACDEDVVRLSRAPSAYASSLLKTCQYCLESPLDCVPGVTGSELTGRIEAIMRTRGSTRLTLWRKALATCVVALSIGTPIAAGSAKGALTHVWGGASSLPAEPKRPDVPFPTLSPDPPAFEHAFQFSAVPSSSAGRDMSAIAAPSAPVSSRSPSLGEPVEAHPSHAGNLFAQSPVGEPRFDAASIRLSPNEQGGPSVRAIPGRYTARGITLGQLIGLSFGEERPLARQQLANMPNWFAETRFDVEATSSAPIDSARALNPTGRAMLRNLLAERFNLRTHFETREQPVLALQLAHADRRVGPELKLRSLGCTGVDIRQTCAWGWGVGRITGTGLTMDSLANLLSGLVPEIERYVVDRTGLTGLFDVNLRWSPEMAVQPRLAPGQLAPMPAVSGDAPSFFTALREQLGLKLEPVRAPIPMLVIDSVTPLVEN